MQSGDVFITPRTVSPPAWLSVLTVLGLSILALIGWALDIAVLKSIGPAWMTMSVITAFCLILSAIGCALLLTGRPTGRRFACVLAVEAPVFLTGLFTLSLYAVAISTGRDPTLENIPFTTLLWPPYVRPALITALLFLVSSISIALLGGGGRPASGLAHGLAIPGLTLSYLVPVSYVLGIQNLHLIMDVSVAFNTGVAFCALFVAILFARPDTWLMSSFSGDHAGAVMARRMLPGVVSAPLLIGWAHLYGERSGALLSESGAAFVVVAITLCLVWLMWMTSGSLSRAESRIMARSAELEIEVAERKKAETSLREAHDHLTERVAERTAELVRLNANLEIEMSIREKVQRETDAANMVLRLMIDSPGRKRFLTELVAFLKEWIGCRCAGIRLVNGGFIPYEAYLGFSRDFWENENVLSLNDDHCACTRVVRGRPDPQDSPCMTKNGSFVLNNSVGFLKTLSPEEAQRFRGLCITTGYKSIALIPIRDNDSLLGAVHLTDEREGCFPASLVSFLEKLSELIGEGVRKFRTEEALVANMAKLEDLNRDLHEFAFIASHDLREPLRKIQAFGDLLARKHGEQIGERGQEYLDRMIDASSRMSELIDALTRYSRVTTRTNPMAVTDMSKVAREAASDLELAIRRNQGEISIDELPQVCADRPQMRQLFQNLIANAIKYQPEGNRPFVKIYGRVENCLCQIYVEDNGIGFHAEQADRIFKPFERLHGRTSCYQGTGMGLAICKKIVERHRGTITATSKPGEGSTFIVTLPVGNSDASAPAAEAAKSSGE